MLQLFGCQTKALPTLENLLSALPAQWVAAWETTHSYRNTAAARHSLAGLWLLAQAEADLGELGYGERGRPALSAPHVDFSITHTDGLVLCAVARGNAPRVGVDAESLARFTRLPTDQLAARWFTDAEQAQFRAAPTAEQFARIWTRKEALVKYRGTGLSDLRTADTVAPDALGLCFTEYRTGDVLATLCHSANETPPIGIEFC